MSQIARYFKRARRAAGASRAPGGGRPRRQIAHVLAAGADAQPTKASAAGATQGACTGCRGPPTGPQFLPQSRDRPAFAAGGGGPARVEPGGEPRG